MTTPISSATSQFIMRNQQAFRHDTIGSMFVHRTVITGHRPVLPPLSDILVLRLTRSSCGVYKTVTRMCSVLSLIFLRFRVTVLRSRAGSRPAGVAATENRTNRDVLTVRCTNIDPIVSCRNAC